jgi:NtrC-family two-component system sensor histidine kinase KinB
LTPREKELLAAAHEETQRLRALVDNLLDLSKIESGRMAMELRPVEVLALVEQAVSLLGTQASERQIELTSQVAPDLGAVVADPTKIIWVLTNLIGNALRFTDPGGHVCVSARQQGHYAYLAVADDGVGIPLEYQSKIFDKFVQVNDNRSIGGTGLGLAISKEIVKAHGGVIWVTSKPGAGSTFTFTLPLAAGQPKALGVNHDHRETEDSHR